MKGMEQFGYGLIVTLIGMGIVFIVLIFLVYLLEGIRIFANKDKEKKEAKTIETIEELPIVEEKTEEKDDEELIAVITAAIAQLMGSQSNLVIKSIIRISDQTPIWAKAGRQDQMLNRL